MNMQNEMNNMSLFELIIVPLKSTEYKTFI